MVVTDREGRIVSWSGSAEALLGFTESQILGQPLFTVLEARDIFGNLLCSKGCGLLEMALRGLVANTFAIEVRTATGARLHVLVSASFSPCERSRGVQRLVYHLRPDRRRHPDRRTRSERRHWCPIGSAEALAGAPQGHPWDLSLREREVLQFLVGGATTADLAARLGVSTSTARHHVRNLLHKMGVHSRVEAVAATIRHRLT